MRNISSLFPKGYTFPFRGNIATFVYLGQNENIFSFRSLTLPSLSSILTCTKLSLLIISHVYKTSPRLILNLDSTTFFNFFDNFLEIRKPTEKKKKKDSSNFIYSIYYPRIRGSRITPLKITLRFSQNFPTTSVIKTDEDQLLIRQFRTIFLRRPERIFHVSTPTRKGE